MTDERIRYIELHCLPDDNYISRYMKQLLKEVKRARRSEKICRAAAIIYKRQLNPVVLLLIMCLVITPAYAGGYRPEPQNVPDGGSNHNALLLGVVIAVGVCAWTKCLKAKPEKVSWSSIPENPRNEYIR